MAYLAPPPEAGPDEGRRPSMSLSICTFHDAEEYRTNRFGKDDDTARRCGAEMQRRDSGYESIQRSSPSTSSPASPVASERRTWLSACSSRHARLGGAPGAGFRRRETCHGPSRCREAFPSHPGETSRSYPSTPCRENFGRSYYCALDRDDHPGSPPDRERSRGRPRTRKHRSTSSVPTAANPRLRKKPSISLYRPSSSYQQQHYQYPNHPFSYFPVPDRTDANSPPDSAHSRHPDDLALPAHVIHAHSMPLIDAGDPARPRFSRPPTPDQLLRQQQQLLPLPPQPTCYWTSNHTRRLEYAAIDAASRGVKGWVRRNLVPECLVPRGQRHVGFDDDGGSVRRYRLDLDDDDEGDYPENGEAGDEEEERAEAGEDGEDDALGPADEPRLEQEKEKSKKNGGKDGAKKTEKVGTKKKKGKKKAMPWGFVFGAR